MRLFQNSSIYPSYLPRLNVLAAGAQDFLARRNAFLADRFGAPHFLQPVLSGDATAFFTNGDDEILQRLWAREKTLVGLSMQDILLAQIEEHRCDVFYNLDPMRFASDFVRRLPGCVRRTIAWRAAPSPRADFSAYDLVVSNFPSILEVYRGYGWRTAYFAPAHDPVMDEYASNRDRPIDVLFVGGFTRHHRRRAQLLETIAQLQGRHVIAMHIDRSRLTRFAESSIGRLLPLVKHRRPAGIQRVSREPLFGRELYAALSKSKIVVNGAIDMAGNDRGNMRCFEAMGCGSLLLSDTGNYPEGMIPDATLITYETAEDAKSIVETLLLDATKRHAIANAGFNLVRSRYSKSRQWSDFQGLL